MLDVCLLGCGGSMPIPERSLTSLLLSYKGRKVLVDCGEGTQVSMKRVGWGFKSIDVICFTHMHADHVLGLPGLMLTIANSEKTDPLTLIGPAGFSEVIRGLMVLCPYLPFEVQAIEMPDDKIGSINFEDLTINTLPVNHTVPCIGFSFDIKRARKFDVEKAKAGNIPVAFWNRLQKGEKIAHKGEEFTPDMVLGEQRKGVKVSYTTDTRPVKSLVNFVSESDLLICEGMYGDDEDLSKAKQNCHMLFSEAAEIARAGKVKELWLTHFSPSLTYPENYLDRTKTIFDNTYLGEDRMTKTLDFKNTL